MNVKKNERAMKGAVDNKECCEEFQDFGKLGRINKIMSETQCSKSCDKTTMDGLEIRLEKSEVSDSKTSISACSCGPECGPDKCEGRNRSVLVGWDSLRTKIFIFLFVAFMLWLVIYVPISLTVLGN